MKIDNCIINKLTFMKVIFPLFYGFFVVALGDKLSFPMFAYLLIALLNLETSALGIIGYGSIFYLMFTGFYHFDKNWNYRWTIVCSLALVLLTAIPIYCNIINGGRYVFIFIAIALLMAAFVIYGSILGLRILKFAKE
ncbi:hypothetical protein CPT03_12850 [Pedobacter ginsengisoli]|uniref:Uncharacterized protein n=1 Tax=Pedobacter ginsengisoli TaxID=363852 RepID=A0A2D1U6T2_9SPHI|nr:hypothetical protein [Pedobacter ginsengisoli]ATP57297.1 hypothetical protein CPT03_12850 [Pedobacter ginsengisoli]